MHEIRIDRAKPLADEPHTGHNRYHPDIPPILEVGEGEEVLIETRDSIDGQLGSDATVADMANMNPGRVHPLTGPVYVKGAEPGDALEIEFLDIAPEPHGHTVIIPGLGFLSDVMTEPFLVNWTMKEGWATSEQIPNVRVPGAPFMGITAVAPSAEKLKQWNEREQRLRDKGRRVEIAL